MCGIAGFWTPHADRQDDMTATATAMADCLAHRGPDDRGSWVDPAAGIALGFRRLAILDLTAEGHQPMTSASGRYVMIFNGEVYNFQTLRKELESTGYIFRGHSDTEVMLSAIEQWGLHLALQRFVGMFAIALWDVRDRTLTLVRDRLGIKPLYYGRVGDALIFGSELKALRAYPGFQPEVDRDSLTLYMRHSYVPTPRSIYHGIYKLPPGNYLTFSSPHPAETSPVTYWSAVEAAEAGVSQPYAGTPAEAVEALEANLRDAVGLRMIADVPLGAFLSGGVDSSTVVALMQAQSSQPVRTFTIGFHEDSYDEARHAREVARHLGTDHTDLYLTATEAQSAIPLLPAMYDEPFADSSQIPTFLVSRLARQQVTVSLSGDGGDELFGGYNRYFWGRALWRSAGAFPTRLRRWGAARITSVAPEVWAQRLGRLHPILPSELRGSLAGDKLHKLAKVLEADSPEALYLGLVSHWMRPADLVVGGHEPPTILTDPACWARLANPVQRMMFLDLVTYLPDDILAKVDRASMAVSLEARVPLLDHRVVEFAWRLPLSMKIRGNQGKWLLRQVLYRHVPRELIERPKMGFGVPIDVWLRGPLRDWAEDLIDEGRLRRQGYLQPEAVREKWQEHQSGKRNWHSQLWNVLMFQAWLEGA